MRVTVTGGAGFIGSAVVRELSAAGYDVVVLDDLSTGCRENLASVDGVRLVEGDLRDRAPLDEALRGSSGVFHVAARVGNLRSIEDPLTDADVNVRGTVELLEAMRRHGVSRLVYSSSAAVYGDCGALPVTEEHACEPESPYGVSKLAGERYCVCYGRLFHWSIACLRYFNVYGPRQRFDAYGNVIPIFATRLLEGADLVVFGDGGQTRDFVSVKDVGAANRRAFEAGVRGVFNIGSGTSTTIRTLAETMINLSGARVAIRHEAPRKGEVVHSRADIQGARRAFGYEPLERMPEGLREYLDWLREDRGRRG